MQDKVKPQETGKQSTEAKCQEIVSEFSLEPIVYEHDLEYGKYFLVNYSVFKYCHYITTGITSNLSLSLKICQLTSRCIMHDISVVIINTGHCTRMYI